MRSVKPGRVVMLVALIVALTSAMWAQEKRGVKIVPSKMPKVATVDPRYVSFNVEMVEVTGGRFWAPFKSDTAAKTPTPPLPDASQPVGGMSSLYEYRAPIDLSNPRLRKLTAALGPSYMRVSGTWQNSSYFQNDDKPVLKDPPSGFIVVLTRPEWKGVIDFAHAVDAGLVTSVAISTGTRDSDGVWTPTQAKAVLDYTKSVGGSVAATEFMNEPQFPAQGGAPKGYTAAAFARDLKVFESFLRKESPKTIFLGPGSIGEGSSLMAGMSPAQAAKNPMSTENILNASGPIFDIFSYHFYPTVSSRCGGRTTVAQALTSDWLDRTVPGEAFYAKERDKYMPGKAIWLTETGEAACGGDRIAGQFADSFRFLNQLGVLAQKGVQVVMQNTLAASDYGLIKENTFDPKPNYWAALLWKRTMGTVVLNPGTEDAPNLRVYAQCMKGHKGGVTVLAMNTDTKQEQTLTILTLANRYTLTAPELASQSVLLNGIALQAGEDGTVPETKGEKVNAGTVRLAPTSITFLTIPSAGNKSCK